MPAVRYERVGKVTTQSVQKCTGKSWDQWIAILNKAGAAKWTYQAISSYLKSRHKLTPWWQHGVTMGYEIVIGRRIEGQNAKGEFAVLASRTFPLSTQKVWALLASPEGQAIWLKPLSEFELKSGEVFESEGGIFGKVRTLKAARRARLAWQEDDWEKPSILQMTLVERPKGKSILVFQHEALAKTRDRDRLREHWKQVLAELLVLATQGEK